MVWVWVETAAFTVELQTNMHGPHPRRVINSSVIGVFITQTEIDIQGSDSTGFLLQKNVPFFKRLETWRISAALSDCFIVLFMKAGSTLPYLHTNKLPLLRVVFDSCQHMAYFWKCIMKFLWHFLWPRSYEAVIVKYCNHICQAFLSSPFVSERFVDDECFRAHV